MNPIPQRKKTAEEIAALRESLAPIGPPPAIAQSQAPAPPPPVERPPAAPRPPVEAKPVKSLRKSEQGPSPIRQSAIRNPQSNLPTQRRDDHELNQIRRSQALEIQNPGTFLIALTAHPVIVATGYAAVLVAAFLPLVDWLWANVALYIPAILCLAGLVIAAYIFLKKKRSLHHAGFIATIAVFTLIFGALYYFPHLRNAP